MVIAAVYTADRTWKQQECPGIDDWIKKMRYICTVDHYLAIRKDEISVRLRQGGVAQSRCKHLQDGW